MPPNIVVYQWKPIIKLPPSSSRKTHSHSSSPSLWSFIPSPNCGSGLLHHNVGILSGENRQWAGSVLGNFGTSCNLGRGQAKNRTERECLTQHENRVPALDVEDAT